ncbi:hypothetical protein MNBD_GAMMA24-80 [hydrothermal vent metagenome]|uniref:Uncharacterized protein n=1 Tax=hydrothermal vent metagenome TaxID=652676 RepID=A0A3B1BFB8_9ZZZZ
MKKHFTQYILSLCSMLLFLGIANPAWSLTVGEQYTISIEKINTDGSLTSGDTSLNISTTATADSDGKLSFTFSSGIPDNSSCNFMVVTLSNSSNAVERRSLIPCPDAGKALPLGVSGVTNNQADTLIAAFAKAGSDDPILAVFGFTIVRSEGITAAELSTLADICYQGIAGTGGFVADMTSKGITSAQLQTYRNKIVSLLADPNTGYSKLLKDSVDVASINDSTLEAAKRGEAAAKLLSYLVQAATTAGFSQDRILEAFNAMGAIAVPLITSAQASGNISAATAKSINSSVGGGIQKLKADNAIEKYTQALAALGATGDDLTTFTTAANTLTAAMTAAFEEFDKVFNGSETDTDVNTADSTMTTAINTATAAFSTATAASNARIVSMIANICTAINVSSSTCVPTSNFKVFQSSGGTANWPIMMVIPTEWLSTIKTAGGSLSYTRDTVSIPTDLQTALGSSTRTNFGTGGQNIPPPYAELFSIQEDVMIREFVRFAAQASAGQDMSAQNTVEKAFSDGLQTIAGNISGTSDGSTAITTAQKEALTGLMKSPQF